MEIERGFARERGRIKKRTLSSSKRWNVGLGTAPLDHRPRFHLEPKS